MATWCGPVGEMHPLILPPGSATAYSTFSAFEVSYKNALYKFTVIIIIIIITRYIIMCADRLTGA